MLRPNFEEPISTAEQIIENNITVFFGHRGQNWIDFFANSKIQAYQDLSKSMILAKSWYDYNDRLIPEGIIENGTHAFVHYGLQPWDLDLGRWWKGDLVVGNYGYAGYLSNKKWHLNKALYSFY